MFIYVHMLKTVKHVQSILHDTSNLFLRTEKLTYACRRNRSLYHRIFYANLIFKIERSLNVCFNHRNNNKKQTFRECSVMKF